MKTLLLAAIAAVLPLGAAPALAAEGAAGLRLAGLSEAISGDLSGQEAERRGRGRGRGGRGGAEDHGGGRDGSGHGGRPRIPGGSGCDDPHDLIEHPECRV